ncbi:MAG: SDR family oxidoreductase [Mogibacterium sp.]|nr:SDR family oxidoreductase [Mogibacterium sp.]
MNKYAGALDFSAKNVIITGGLSGAGKEISKVFIESGANVILTYNHSSDAASWFRENYPGHDIKFFRLDQSDLGSIEEFAAWLGSLDVKVDCLVNNAGIYPAKDIDDIEPDDYDAMMDTNTRGLFFLVKAIRHLLAEGSSVINISSINATNPARKLAHYGISKAAVEMMTRSQAQAYGPEVRVNCIAPGLIFKQGQEEFIPGWTESYKERSPLHKLVLAEEIGKTCLFLASDLSSAITGQTITVDCGIQLAPCFYNELE